MLEVAVSQLTTARWELADEIAAVRESGFARLAVWRPKLSDLGASAAAAALMAGGVGMSSLQWAGGFTGSDGRSFRESVADAEDAIRAAAVLADAAAVRRPGVLVLHSGCRGGHTRSHAVRLLGDAVEALAPVADREGVVLAVRPVHAAAAPGCSFVTDLADALDMVAAFAEPSVRLAVDLWQFGDMPGIEPLLPRVARAAAVVQVADRRTAPTADADRLPVGHGMLPLEPIVRELCGLGYAGPFEFDPVGETVESLGYGGTLREIRRVVDAWTETWAAEALSGAARRADPERSLRGGHFRGAGGSRRSQASSQAVSRG